MPRPVHDLLLLVPAFRDRVESERERALGAVWAVFPLAVMSATWLAYGAASVAAWLRGGDPYRDNSFERHARADIGGGLGHG